MKPNTNGSEMICKNTFVQLIERWFRRQAETSGVTPVRVGKPCLRPLEEGTAGRGPSPARAIGSNTVHHLFLEQLLTYCAHKNL